MLCLYHCRKGPRQKRPFTHVRVRGFPRGPMDSSKWFFHMQGWVKLHRQFRDSPYYKECKAKSVWIECLLRANYGESQQLLRRQKIQLDAGQFVMGREEFGKSIGISGSTAWYWLGVFEADSMIDIKKTSKGSIVTVLKWSEYQEDLTVELTTDEQQKNSRKTHKKKVKKDKKVKKIRNNIAANFVAADTQKVFEKFQMTINPNIQYGNKTQRGAAERLLQKFGLEKVLSTVDYLVTIQADRFAPVITTPYQLEQKFAQLLAYHKKQPQSPNLVSI